MAVIALAGLQAGGRTANAAEINFCFNFWAPYAFKEDGAIRGVSIDVLTEASRRAGYVATFTELPWNRCIQAVESGEMHAVLDAAERSNFLQGPTSYSVYSNTFWVHADNTLYAADLEELQDGRIGLVSGYEYPDDLIRAIEANGLTIDYSVDDEANLRKLAFKRVDVIVADRVSTLWRLQRQDLRLRPLDPDHSADRLYPSFNKAFGERQRKIDEAIQKMQADGELQRIFESYVNAAAL